MTVHVIAENIDTGERTECVIEPGDYVLIVATPCELVARYDHDDGTHVLTLEGCDTSHPTFDTRPIRDRL